ncbi:MAG: terminase [Rhodovulum sp.]|nr:terminase [Rhodovulum sp.]
MPFDLACPDWWDRLQAGRLPVPDLPIDDDAAAPALQTFGLFRVPDMPGQPELFDAAADWFPEIIRHLWGVLERPGVRFFTEAFVMVPKKNGKTTYSAALGLAALMLTDIPGAEILILGPTKDAADTLFSQAAKMIRADPEDPATGRSELETVFNVVENQMAIKRRDNGAQMIVRALNTKVVVGKILILAIVDELHEMGSMPEAEKVLRQVRGGMQTRDNTLLLFITTQSDGPPKGLFLKELNEARAIRDGTVSGDVRTFVCMYELPLEVQTSDNRAWRDTSLWPPLWPNYGKTVFLDKMRRLHERATRDGIDSELGWASQHLNLQLGMGSGVDQWVGARLWLDAAEAFTLDEFLDRCEVVTAGVDGGGLDDLLALGLLGREKVTKNWLGWGRAWASSEVLGAASSASDDAKARRPGIKTELEEFIADGDLFPARGETGDIEDLADILSEVAERGLFPEKFGIGLDPYGVAALVDILAERDLEDPLVVAVPQGARLSSAVWGMERRLKSRTFRPRKCRLLSWSAGNAKAEQRGNAVYITKAVAGRAKIDPLTALFNAFQLMAMNPTAAPQGPKESPWNDPNFSILGQYKGA